ncbi:Tetratricopeptide repeat, ankyrin repeat and coiled-coil containing 1a [Balamuthia mandrillaris]
MLGKKLFKAEAGGALPSSSSSGLALFVKENDVQGLEQALAASSSAALQRESGLLALACAFNHADVAKLLLAKGANPNEPNEKGLYPLHLAAKRGNPALGHTEVVEVLLHPLAEGETEEELAKVVAADVNVRNQFYNNTALGIAARTGNLALVQLLVGQQGIDLDKQNRSLSTPLHEAAAAGHADIVKILLERGADTTKLNGLRKTAKQVASPAIQALFP